MKNIKTVVFITALFLVACSMDAYTQDKDNLPKISSVQYTDLQGFSNDKPNGLFQQELRFTFPLLRGLYNSQDSDQYRFWLLKSVTFPSVIFNRIDKSNKSTNYPVGKIIPESSSNTDSLSLFLTTMDLYKYNNFQATASVVVAAAKVNTGLIQLQYSLGFIRNKPFYVDTFTSGADSGRVADDLRPVYSFINKVELNFQNHIKDAFSIFGSAGLMWLTLKDSKYEQFDVTELDQFDRATGLLPVNNATSSKSPRPILYLTALVEKPWANNKNAVFFRVNYFYQGGAFTNIRKGYDPQNPAPSYYKDYYHNHFLQLQLGVSLGLEKVLGITSEANEDPPQQNQPVQIMNAPL